MTMVHHVLVLDQTLFNDVLEEPQISKPRKFKKKISEKFNFYKKKQFKLTFFSGQYAPIWNQMDFQILAQEKIVPLFGLNAVSCKFLNLSPCQLKPIST